MQDVNSKNNEGETPLHIAVLKGYDKIVKLLVKYGADINVISKKNLTPLSMAQMGKHEKIAKWLIKQGAITK